MSSVAPLGDSPWLDAPAPAERSPLTGTIAADVAVVGAGIVGLTTAFLLQRAGASVVVLEARTIAGATSGHTTAKLTPLHQLVYAELCDRFDAARARSYAQANVDAVRWIGDTVAQEGMVRTRPASCSCRPQRRHQCSTKGA